MWLVTHAGPLMSTCLVPSVLTRVSLWSSFGMRDNVACRIACIAAPGKHASYANPAIAVTGRSVIITAINIKPAM